jgi:Trk K+ transport system NAD-binding subunit
LNPNVKIAVKSTTSNHTENLKDLDAEVIVNPFSIISSEISLALWSPNLFKLEKWLYGIDNLNATLPIFPKGLYIICGYGRMGKRVFEKLNEHDIEVKLIEIDKNKNLELTKDEISHLVFGNADDRELLLEVGIKEAVAIAAITDNDTTNLSILATAKKLNPNIVTIVRENEIADDFLFKNANINHIFTPSRILVNKVTNALVMPLSDKFLKLIIKKDNIWASKLVARLLKEIDAKPLLLELEINENTSPQIYKYLLGKEFLTMDLLATSLYNKEQKNNVVPLLLQRENDTILLPLWEEELKIGDKILLACDSHAKDDIEYICQNIYEFYYAITGKEKQTILKGFL